MRLSIRHVRKFRALLLITRETTKYILKIFSMRLILESTEYLIGKLN